jgi:hypothetical protein
MVAKTRKRKQRGGSLASQRVTNLAPKSCEYYDYPSAVAEVMTDTFVSNNESSFHRTTGGGKKSTSTNWFTHIFIPDTIKQVNVSKHPTKIIKNMVNRWNSLKRNPRLKKKDAANMLRELTEVNYRGGALTSIPLRWISPPLSSNGDVPSPHWVGGAESSCASVPAPLDSTQDSYSEYRGTSGDSNKITGSTIPQNSFQKIQNWWEGETTLFSPTRGDVSHNPDLQTSWTNTDSQTIRSSSFPSFTNSQYSVQNIDGNGTKDTNVFAPYVASETDPAQTIPYMRAGKRNRRRKANKKRSC